MSLAREIIEPDSAGPFALAVADAKRLLPGAGRFQVNEAVMNAVGRMERTGFDRLLALLPRALLPFPTRWIEWPEPGGGGNIGFLCETLAGDGFAFRQYLNRRVILEKLGFPIMSTFGRIRVEPSGWSAEDSADAKGASPQTTVNFLEQAAMDILGLLLIINSPSKVLEVGNEAGNARIDAKRARQGRPPLPNLRPIRFDVARFQRVPPRGIFAGNSSRCRRAFRPRTFQDIGNWDVLVVATCRYQREEEPVPVPKDYEVRNTGLPDDDQEEGDG